MENILKRGLCPYGGGLTSICKLGRLCYTTQFCLWFSIHPRCLCRWANAQAPKERTDTLTPVPLLANQQGVLQKNAIISVCNALWSTHPCKHQFCGPEGGLLHRSSSSLVRPLAKTGVWGIANPRGNICCCCQRGFFWAPQLGRCSPLTARASALSTCSPLRLFLLLWVKKGSDMGQADGFLFFCSILVKALQTRRSTY